MSLLQARGLSVALAGQPVLDGIDFQIDAGELVGLIGPNGAGKTTLLRALAGLQAVTAGRVTLAGCALAEVAERERARQLAYLAQGAECHWPLTVERLVALGRLPHLSPWRRPDAKDAQAITAAMRAADVTGFAGRTITTLSAGERVRVLLARALAVEPQVLLADEPVASLDPAHQLQVMQLLRDRSDAGHAVVVVLHDLTLAARFCQRLVLLAGGKVLASGAPEMVLTPDMLRLAYGVRVEIVTLADGIAIVPWQRIEPGAAA